MTMTTTTPDHYFILSGLALSWALAQSPQRRALFARELSETMGIGLEAAVSWAALHVARVLHRRPVRPGPAAIPPRTCPTCGRPLEATR